jgi:hypothetical protein
VLGLSLLIARSRPRAAGLVLGTACTATGVVVLYSAVLLGAFDPLSDQRQLENETAAINREARRLTQHREQYYHLLSRLGKELIAGRRSLREAVERLAETDRARDADYLRALFIMYPDRSFPERVAASFMCNLVASLEGDHQAAWKLALRLEREFQSTFGKAPPLSHRPVFPVHPSPTVAAALAVGPRTPRSWMSEACRR